MCIKIIRYTLLFFLIVSSSVINPLWAQSPLLFNGPVENDLLQLLREEGIEVHQYNDLNQLLSIAEEGMGVIVAAGNYPTRKVAVNSSQYSVIKQKKLRLYIEYPEFIPGMNLTQNIYEGKLERAVISSGFFGNRLPEMSILSVNGCHIIPVAVKDPIISYAKVAGFDVAQYGLTETDVYPLLFKRGNLIIAATKLSDFKKARFGPSESWKIVWEDLLSWLTGGKKITLKNWKSDPSPSFYPDVELSKNAGKEAVSKGTEWFWNARLFIHPSWEEAVLSKYQPKNGDPNLFFGPPIGKDMLIGDGSRGIMEGHASAINWDGSQQYRYFVRADVQGESAFMLAAAGNLLDMPVYRETSERLLDYLFYTSGFRGGEKSNKDVDVYGLLAWANTHPDVFFNDDNARCILGAIGATAFLNKERWNKFIVENILANLRTCSKQGFQGNALTKAQIEDKGWRYFNERDFTNPHPHFESWMWACYLWLYDKTGYVPLLEKAKAGIKFTMDAYPEKWLSQNGIQQERARMVLPLAWLVRVEDTSEHRKWLDVIVSKLLESQVKCGAIREELGSLASDKNKLFVSSNKAYGTNEAPLIAKNGDPVSDMLYTCNFAFFALNEAARATGEQRYSDAVKRLSDFLIRIQAESKNHIDVDGAWFRAFDYNSWDYWASNADNGWGAWSTLSGWTQSWIVGTQVMVENNQCFWDVTQDISLKEDLNQSLWMME